MYFTNCVYPYQYQHPNYVNLPVYHYPRGYVGRSPLQEKTYRPYNNNGSDFGPNPFVININAASKMNNTFRTALWTGNNLQVTLMSLNVGEDIGLEMHPDVDQFLRVEQGQGVVQMGPTKDNLNFQRNVFDDSAIFLPAGTWHNLTNTGNIPLKLYSIYAPPNHPFGTVHVTKQDAILAEEGNHHGME